MINIEVSKPLEIYSNHYIVKVSSFDVLTTFDYDVHYIEVYASNKKEAKEKAYSKYVGK